jgi:hypothetical protein
MLVISLDEMNTLSFIELLRGGSLTDNEKLKVLEDLRGGESVSSSSMSSLDLSSSTTTGNSSPIVTVSFTSDTSLPVGGQGLDQVNFEDFKTGLFFDHFCATLRFY